MKRLRFILLAMSLVFLYHATPGFSQELATVTDNLGRKWLKDPATASVPGAGSGFGALVGTEAEILPSWEQHMFDIVFALEFQGTPGDQNAEQETGIGRFGFLYIPKTESGWFAIGTDAGRSFRNSDEFDISLPLMRFTLFPDPFSAVRWNFSVRPLSFTFRTGNDADTPRNSGFSFNPSGMFGVEIPRDKYAVELGAGASYPFSIQGVGDQELNSAVNEVTLNGMVTVYWRKR